MGRFDLKFTDGQKAALLAATVDDDGPRLSIIKALDLAKRGKLEGAEAFEMSASYAHELVREEKRLRQGISADTQAPGDRLDGITRRMVTSLDAGVRAYERKARTAARPKSRVQPPDPQDLVRLARAGQEIRKLMREAGDKPKPPSERKGAAPNTEVERMLSAMNASEGGAPTPELAPDDDATIRPLADRAERTREGPPLDNEGQEHEAVGAERHAADPSGEAQHASEDEQRRAAARADFRSALAEIEAQAQRAQHVDNGRKWAQ